MSDAAVATSQRPVDRSRAREAARFIGTLRKKMLAIEFGDVSTLPFRSV
jgi:hypothetical protein